MTRQEISDHLFEALNGLNAGWSAANFRDETARNHARAPISAALESVRALLDFFDPMPEGDAKHRAEVARFMSRLDAAIAALKQ